jgi:hypothetical protein
VRDDIEEIREEVEGNLACLGNVLVLLCLVQERLDQAVKTSRQADLLLPAVADLRSMERLIRRVQRGLCRPSDRKMQQDKKFKKFTFLSCWPMSAGGVPGIRGWRAMAPRFPVDIRIVIQSRSVGTVRFQAVSERLSLQLQSV